MSDGNFNRSLLPAGSFLSGVRAGRASERSRALEAFKELLTEIRPDADDPERQHLLSQFKTKLISKENNNS